MASYLIDPQLSEKINSLPAPMERPCSYPEIRVACIMDTFSYECFKYECTLLQLQIDRWGKQLEEFKPHFLLVESAWRGVNDSWRHQLTSTGKHDYSHIKNLVRYCNKMGIPTVFWNKEDPPNFPYFITAASLFDYIFTTDENCIDKYKQAVKHNQVYSLPFAAQPSIHNPMYSKSFPKGTVAFAGTWYQVKHLPRQNQINMLLKPALPFGLKIFDRMFLFQGNNNYRFPDAYQKYIAGYLEYEDMVKAYKLFSIFLNANSVTNSPTMFSRRVFELLASGTNVISSPSAGISAMFPNIVNIASTEEETKAHIETLLNNEKARDKLSLLGIREVYKKHLYKHRFERILEVLGLRAAGKKDGPGVSLITVSTNKKYIANILENYKNIDYKNKELIVLINSDEINEEDWAACENITVKKMPASLSYGECFRTGISLSKLPYAAVFDEEHYYGPNYLTDAMNAFTWSMADIVGKSTYYAFVESKKALVIRKLNKEYCFTKHVSGTTMIINKEVFNSVPYPSGNEGTDTKFLKECAKQGIKVFSADRFNHVRLKSAGAKKNSWRISDEKFMEKSAFLEVTENFKKQVTV